MKPFGLAPGVNWTGILDPQRRVFDVIMRAEHGTTYNSYLVQGTRAAALIDTAKADFSRDFLENLGSLTDLSRLDFIVVNHTEPDHSGSLPLLLEKAPGARILAAPNCVPFLKAILHRDPGIRVVGETDRIDLGGKTLRFLDAPFLHWPDTMFTFLEEEGILFPCDVLGAHWCDDRMFDDLVGDYGHSFRYYFDVIFRPFKEHVRKALDKVDALPVRMVAPSHGPILRGRWKEALASYREWAAPVTPGPARRVLVFYASSYGNTARMAEEVAAGARAKGADVAVFDLQAVDPLALLDDIEAAGALAVGSLTINGDAVEPVWRLLSSLATLKLKGKAGGAFGSFGWSGEGPRFIEERMKELKFRMPADPVRAQLVPMEKDLEACRELGGKLAQEALKGVSGS